VLEPNYSTNRGWALDDVSGMSADDIEAAIYDEQLQGVLKLLDSVTLARDAAEATIKRLSVENEELLSMLTRQGVENPQAVLDAALDEPPIMPFPVSLDSVARFDADSQFFRAAPTLPMPVAPPAPPKKEDELFDRLLGRQ